LQSEKLSESIYINTQTVVTEYNLLAGQWEVMKEKNADLINFKALSRKINKLGV